MSFWANENSSTISINSADPETNPSFLPFFFHLLGSGHGPEFHGDANETPETEERGVEEHIWGREGWAGFMAGEAPCTRAFLLLVGARLISSRATEVSVQRAHWPAELRQQNQQWVSRGQRHQALCNNQESSVSWREAAIAYSPENIVLNEFLKDPLELIDQNQSRGVWLELF